MDALEQQLHRLPIRPRYSINLPSVASFQVQFTSRSWTESSCTTFRIPLMLCMGMAKIISFGSTGASGSSSVWPSSAGSRGSVPGYSPWGTVRPAPAQGPTLVSAPPVPPPCISSAWAGMARAPAASKCWPWCWTTWSRSPGGSSGASPAPEASTACRATGDMLSCAEAYGHQDPARALHSTAPLASGVPLFPTLRDTVWGHMPFVPSAHQPVLYTWKPVPTWPLILLPWLHLAHIPRPHQSARSTSPGVDIQNK